MADKGDTRAAPVVRHRTVAERAELGREARRRVRRSQQGEWSPPSGRDPLAILEAQETTRVPELVPLRHERMSESPFTFYRGAAAVMAADLAGEPQTGLKVQLCGDAHLANFGGFASPERSLVFDLNDFDETLPGPFEWDLKRLAASFEVAARHNGFADKERAGLQTTLTDAYARSMARFSAMSSLDVWYLKLTAEDIMAGWGTQVDAATRKRFLQGTQKAQSKDRLKALRKLTTVTSEGPRFLSEPPVLEPVRELLGDTDAQDLTELLHEGLRAYRATLQPDRRALLERYRFVDIARKVVGVGSVGTRCWVMLLVGNDEGDPLFLQVKEAEASVLEGHLPRSVYRQQGRRVVEGQRLLQASSDIFLGWDRFPGLDGRDHDYYFRQLWDWKVSADTDTMAPAVMGVYAQICGYTLARAHARSGDAVAISSYLGNGRSMGRAMIAFASAYADQNERDHAAFVAHVTATG